MSRSRAELEERRLQALRDLVEVRRQREDGELDPSTAADLATRYEAEAAAAISALERFEAEGAAHAGPVPAGAATGNRRRRPLAVAAMLVVLAAIGLLVPRFAGERPAGGFVTGNEATSRGRQAGPPAEELERVVADNPDVVGMRLELAHRYLDSGQFDRAVEHYMAVLDREPHPQALSHLGWIMVITGEYDLAERLLDTSLDRAPGAPEALWFRANLLLDGRDDPRGAAAIAQRLLARDDLDAAFRSRLEGLLADARQRLEGQP